MPSFKNKNKTPFSLLNDFRCSHFGERGGGSQMYIPPAIFLGNHTLLELKQNEGGGPKKKERIGAHCSRCCGSHARKKPRPRFPQPVTPPLPKNKLTIISIILTAVTKPHTSQVVRAASKVRGFRLSSERRPVNSSGFRFAVNQITLCVNIVFCHTFLSRL